RGEPGGGEEAVTRLSRPLPPLAPAPRAALSPTGLPLSLADLQRLAIENSPQLRQAAASVEAARGAAIQARLYPNPNLGYLADQVGSSGSAGQQGFFFEQLIKTGG